MKKILKEFKTFITRGNVLDLAVGMIIGAAFTAIVNALVNGIFKPLINFIPINDMKGLITPLKMVYVTDAATGESVVDLANSIYINWGDFIMAIVNFLITAMVLFLIIKLINSFREGAKKYKVSDIPEDLRAELRAKGMNRRQMVEYVAAQKAEEQAKAKEEAERNKPETTDQILADIRELLKANAAQKIENQ